MIPFYEHKTLLAHAFCARQMNFPPHFHSCAELLRLHQGQMLVQIDRDVVEVKSGQLAVIFPDTIHSYQTLSAPEEIQLELFILGEGTGGEWERALRLSRPEQPVLQLDSLHPDVTYGLDALLREEPDWSDEPAARALVQLCWARLLPRMSLVRREREQTDLPRQLVSYMLEHFQEPVSLSSLSRIFGVSVSALSRVFTNTLHTGFSEYLNHLRIEQAKKMLLETELSILEVGFACGFQSQQTFNRVFLDYCGCTPRSFRQSRLP